MGTSWVITLGQLLSLGAIVFLIGVGIWLLGRKRKQETRPAFLEAVAEPSDPVSVVRLKEEINDLRAQVSQLRQEMDALKANRSSAAPNYTQAIEMSRQGAPVADVANRCGISRAEAELIVAMHGSKDRT